MTILDMTNEWLMFANNDLIAARHLFENLYPKQTYIAAFHSQQCAEKALKAFLVFHDIDPPKTHDLDELVKLCMNIDSEFSKLEIDCVSLTRYGIASRYPKEILVDDIIAKNLIERAQRVYDFSVAKIHTLTNENEQSLESGI